MYKNVENMSGDPYILVYILKLLKWTTTEQKYQNQNKLVSLHNKNTTFRPTNQNINIVLFGKSEQILFWIKFVCCHTYIAREISSRNYLHYP